MKALTWQGRRTIGYGDVPDPRIEEPTDAVVKVTSSGICGSDLHLYEVMGPFLDVGDVLGHEVIGVVEETGSAVGGLQPGDRVVVPFQIACGSCFMCTQGLQTQCETTQVRDQKMGAALFGYTKLYGQVPGGQAEYLRVPQAQYGPIKVPEGPPDDRFVYLSDVLPTAWQAVEYAGIPDGGTVVVLGLGPIGDMACRIALHRGHRVLGVDLVPDRLRRAQANGVETVAYSGHVADELRDLTGGRGPDSVIDAVGMEAHGSPVARLAQQAAGLLPDAIERTFMRKAGVDRMAALLLAVDVVRRGGTVSLVGVYGGAADPLPMMTMFDKQIQLRMGQANVRRWSGQILPLLTDEDPLHVDTFATHHLPLADGPAAYRMFQQKEDGAVKVLLKP
ncbi:alcohol dehydrogenase catalytic domain-containing protein [Kribbella sp.]|uniref:alcohol dehydrogenase catalytic domain-containing protein n=1 Tax=Kribbella sp. TaxID=1871183 RepID=UPI002D28C2CD|nr:alcohol dehydrogenase catalytic domain-containing protein [Kribbella sp.]HZX02846.1 alcohol dehydrogenase catalytic domain-containing protein [Kribbella sp.]